MEYEFRYIVKMTNGKKYEIITNFHGEKDVLKYIDSHDYIDLFDRKTEEMVAVKSEYVMSVLYKDSQKIDSEGDKDWADREDYLKEENEKLKLENTQLEEEVEYQTNQKFELFLDKQKLKREIEKLEEENEHLRERILKMVEDGVN